MRYYIEIFGSYETEHYFDFKSYDDAFNYLIHNVLEEIPIEELENNKVPDYMDDVVYSITRKAKDKHDTGKDYYIIEKEDNEITKIYGGG